MMRGKPRLGLKRWRYGWLPVALIVLALSACHEGREGLTGKTAPEFALTMLDKSAIKLSGLKGKPVLLEFWAPWCPGCLKNIPALKKAYFLYGDKVAFVASSSERGEKTVGKFVADQEIPYPVALSTQKLLTDYGVSAIPRTVLIDAEGVVRYVHTGQFSFEELEKKIKDVLPAH